MCLNLVQIKILHFEDKYSVWSCDCFYLTIKDRVQSILCFIVGSIFYFLAINIKNVLFTTLTSTGKDDKL